MSEFPSGISPNEFPQPFATQYRQHLQHLHLMGLRPKTIDAYARAMRRIGAHFDFQVSALSPAQLSDYFSTMLRKHVECRPIWPSRRSFDLSGAVPGSLW